jgi:hypothetical protein
MAPHSGWDFRNGLADESSLHQNADPGSAPAEPTIPPAEAGWPRSQAGQPCSGRSQLPPVPLWAASGQPRWKLHFARGPRSLVPHCCCPSSNPARLGSNAQRPAAANLAGAEWGERLPLAVQLSRIPSSPTCRACSATIFLPISPALLLTHAGRSFQVQMPDRRAARTWRTRRPSGVGSTAADSTNLSTAASMPSSGPDARSCCAASVWWSTSPTPRPDCGGAVFGAAAAQPVPGPGQRPPPLAGLPRVVIGSGLAQLLFSGQRTRSGLPFLGWYHSEMGFPWPPAICRPPITASRSHRRGGLPTWRG